MLSLGAALLENKSVLTSAILGPPSPKILGPREQKTAEELTQGETNNRPLLLNHRSIMCITNLRPRPRKMEVSPVVANHAPPIVTPLLGNPSKRVRLCSEPRLDVSQRQGEQAGWA